MNVQPVLLVLTFANLGLVMLALLQTPAAVAANEVAPVLRGRALEIVDDQGKVRASITIHPASTEKTGESYAETVVLRLITERGRPVVKIGASERDAGLALVGPSGTERTYVQLGAKDTAGSLKLKNENGRETVIAP